MNGNAAVGNITVLIIVGEAGKNQASAEVLAANLALLEQTGEWKTEFVTPNGINTWTVIARKTAFGELP